MKNNMNIPLKNKPATTINWQQKAGEWEDKYKRALADYQNLERRTRQEKEEVIKWSNARLWDKLLAILDDLDRASAHINDKGLKMVMEKITSLTNSEGLEEIDASGKQFDPQTMDCVEMVEGANNQVVEVLQKGYRLFGRVLRPSKVKVGKGGLSADLAAGKGLSEEDQGKDK